MIDNGHMPIFDEAQTTNDLTYAAGPQGRLNVPWGRLVFDYFTALPLEELARPYTTDQWNAIASALGGLTPPPDGTRLTDLATIDKGLYRDYYRGLFFGYPYQSPETSAPSPLGPRVEGRININLAPQWVLEGLPVLKNSLLQFSEEAIPEYPTDLQPIWLTDLGEAPYYYPYAPMTGLPVPQIWQGWLDPQLDSQGDPFTDNHDQVADQFMSMLFDEDSHINTFSTVSPTLARYMVSYREMRPVACPAGVDGCPADGIVNAWAVNENDLWELPTNMQPGFVSVGQMADLVGRVRLPEVNTRDENGAVTPLANRRLEDLRNHLARDSAGDALAYKPYAYVGYLQLVAPLVRLQDWATVKNHVYTIYTTVGDTADPPTWMRNQVTVDRTQCLYSNELPKRITETRPIGYFDSINDQR